MIYAGTKQDEFRSYERLVLLRNIAQQYTEGKNYCPTMEKVLEQITSCSYRVAVIGEFKRGKSSLLNALLGTQVLPTDILPTTGTVSRIVYGTTQNMTICYKDGTEEQRDLSELRYYGTKLEEHSEERLQGIREILVQYPSVFCKNGIELIDTPGLNDDEHMTETTLGVLKDIDAAIVVISAKMPLSMTERDLIVRLLTCREIHDIVFVVTFIDAVSNRRREQDRMIEYIRQRITEETFALVQETYGTDPELMAKANRLLKEPRMFAVSSTLAMEGFLRDDIDLLEESRFPSFKNELLANLTAQQSTMVGRKTQEIELHVKENFPLWYQAEQNALDQQRASCQENHSQAESYFANARTDLEKEFLEIDRTVEALDVGTLLQNCKKDIKQEFVHQLCTLNGASPTEEDIRRVLGLGTLKANEQIDRFYCQLTDVICKACITTEQGFIQRRNRLCPETESATFLLTVSKPELDVNLLYPTDVSLTEWDIMPYLEAYVEKILQNLYTEFENARNLWRRDLLTLIRKDEECVKPALLAQLAAQQRTIDLARATLQRQYQIHRQTVYLENSAKEEQDEFM